MIGGGLCPVQYEGEIEGHPYYFRARGSTWSLELAQPGNDSFISPVLYVWGYYGEPDDIYGAGYMEEKEVKTLIHEIANKYLTDPNFRGEFQWKADSIVDGLRLLCHYRYDELKYGTDFAQQVHKNLAEFMKKQSPEVIAAIETKKSEYLKKIEDLHHTT